VREKLESLVAEMIEKRILLDEAVEAFEKKFIQLALGQTNGNQSKAAEVLGVHRNTLSRKIALHKLNGHRR
jgi:DNA-binding NtrC family response regulator